MRFKDLFRFGGTNLLRRKTRAVLTALSMAVGVMCIVVLISVGLGYEQSYRESIESMGSLTKIGAYMGTLVVQYEDANGQLYTATAQVQLNVEDPENSNNNAVDPNQGGNGSGNGGGNGSGGSGFFGTIWPWIILAVIVIAAAAAVIIAVSKKKKSPIDPT